jgi:predicted metalloprotease with PDZ domain
METIHAILVAAAVLASIPQSPPTSTAPANTYEVTVPEQDKRLAKVRARLTVRDDVLSMASEGAPHLQDGWSTFIRSLEARDNRGRILNLQYLGKSRWRIPRPLPASIELSYEVLIHHDQGTWPFGHDEAAYAKRDCVFYTGNALFITTSALSASHVTFNLPVGWRVSSAWSPASGSPASFSVADANELTNTAMLVGRHAERTISSGQLRVMLAMGGELAPSMSVFESALDPLIPAATALFGNVAPGRFLFIANRDVFTGGGGFHRSISMLFKDPPDQANAKDVLHVLTHELLHLWTGQMRAARQADVEWFVEGFTDYFAHILQVQTGLLTEDDLLVRWATKYDEYLQAAGVVSMTAAGGDKNKHYNLLYSGGLILALALDIELRRAPAASGGLAAVMRRVYEEYGDGKQTYTGADLWRVVNAFASRDVAAVFRKYVDGNETIALNKWLDEAGLAVMTESHDGKTRTKIVASSGANDAHRALLRAIINRH